MRGRKKDGDGDGDEERERITVAIAPTFFFHILGKTSVLVHVASQGSLILGY
jgi:hypothetical protein